MHHKRFLIVSVCALLLMLMALPAAAQTGVSVTCTNGPSFENGVEIQVIQMRAGFTYTATVIGLGDFDPILAVLDPNGRGLCADDVREAASYNVDLPTTGAVRGNNLASQVRFDQRTGRNMADVSLVVGSVNNMPGEFVLILEGMAATAADGAGDPFGVRLTPDMIASGIPLSVYMVAVTNSVDPFMAMIDADYNYREDVDGNTIYCDDASDANLCWSGPYDVRNSYVTRRGNQRLPLYDTDSILTMRLDDVTLDSNPDNNFFNFIMTTYQQSTFGDYVIAFHAGVDDGTNIQTQTSGGTSKSKP